MSLGMGCCRLRFIDEIIFDAYSLHVIRGAIQYLIYGYYSH